MFGNQTSQHIEQSINDRGTWNGYKRMRKVLPNNIPNIQKFSQNCCITALSDVFIQNNSTLIVREKGVKMIQLKTSLFLFLILTI